MINQVPVSIQTLYADLVDRSWGGSFAELLQAGGMPYKQHRKGRDYWYLKQKMVAGVRQKDIYLGPDSEDVMKRVNEFRDLKRIRKDRVDIVRALRQARFNGPDRFSGQILSKLGEAGFFRLRAVVVGSVAFQTYEPMLGVRFQDSISRTSDLDLAQFHSISISVADQVERDFLSLLREIDPRFRAVPDAFDKNRTMRYVIGAGAQEEFSVDLLCPHVGPDRRSRVTSLPALQGDAQLLRYLDFLIYDEINAVALHDIGVPINVPAPERYAVHKLIVSQMRVDTAHSQTKARKDLAQAQSLIEVLLADRSHELAHVWNEALERGPKWSLMLLRSADKLEGDIKEGLLGLTDVDSTLRFIDQPGF